MIEFGADGFDEILEHDIEAPVFYSFDELKAVIEIEPPIVSTKLLIQAVRSRLQLFAVVEEWRQSEDSIPYMKEDTRERERDEEVLAALDEHDYLKRALVKLEERRRQQSVNSA